jgi:hypothetical protein
MNIKMKNHKLFTIEIATINFKKMRVALKHKNAHAGNSHNWKLFSSKEASKAK